MNYAINKIDDNFYQIYGNINGILSRPWKVGNMPLEGELSYFLNKHTLVKARVKVYNERQMKEKLDRIVEECNNESSKI
jgi:hypothetical protein